MGNFNSTILNDAIEKLTIYVTENYSEKSSGYYQDILKGLKEYAAVDERDPADVITSYYEVITKKRAFERPETGWLMLKARTMFMLLDIMNGNEPKREYIYNKDEYSGTFISQLISYGEWQEEIGNSKESLRRKNICIRNFLRFLESNDIYTPEGISVDHVLTYLQSIERVSDDAKRYTAYMLRSFLMCPAVCDKLSFNAEALLSGFRRKPNNKLKSFYTPEELRKVMNAVDRTTRWGKTIYVMMLLACVYGLRVSDIRELHQSSVRWEASKIELFQKKTKKHVELPLTEEVKLALLDYLRNVRPKSSNPHLFIRHQHPYIPYSEKDNFGSKVAAYFREAGINTDGKHFGMHSLRFSLATELLADGVPINEIGTILGHKSIKSAKEYAWSDIKHLKDAALEVPPYAGR